MIRSIRAFILIAIFSASLIATVEGADETFPYVATVKSNKVLIRSGQNENFEKVGRVNKGDFVVVTGRSYSWYKVKLPVDSKNYIHSDFVISLRDGIGEVKGNRVNIRAQPKIAASLVGQADKGTMVRILEKKEDWYRIEPIDQSYGWILGKFLEYHSSNIPPPRVVQLPTRNIYVKRQQERQKKAVETAKNKVPENIITEKPVVENPVFSAVKVEVNPNLKMINGLIQDLGDDAVSSDIRHKIVVDGKTVYFLKGFRRIIDSFANHQVKIEGEIQPNVNAKKPVLLVSKIHLVL